MKKSTQKYSKVLLVGRTNVGKSTLFNRLTEDVKTIVLDQEGITRDYVTEIITWNNKQFELIDTGGISFKKQKDPIVEEIRQKVFKLFEKSALIIFVGDVKIGLTSEDQKIIKILHKTKKPLLLVINKSDNIGGAAVACKRLLLALITNKTDARLLVQEKNTNNKRFQVRKNNGFDLNKCN